MSWGANKLGNLCKIQLGKTPSRANKAFWDESKKEHNVWLSIADMPHTTKAVISSSKEHITSEGAKICNLVPKGTLLLSFKLSIGRLAFAGKDLYTNEAIASLTIIDDNLLDKEYLYWYLMFFDWDNAVGNDVKIKGKTLNKEKLKEINIVLPPLEEQKRIVAILDQAFAEIDQVLENAETNLKNARELFEGYLQQIFSQRGEGWIDRTLNEASLDFGRGKSKHRPRNDESLFGGPYPFIQTGDVRNCEHLITSYSKTYNEKGLEQSKLWPKGTICITIAANIAETGILDFDACFPDSVIGVVINPEIASISFVEFLLQSFKTILKAQGKGSAQDNINLGTFENLKFPFPPLNQQVDMVESLSSMMTLTQELENLYLSKLEALEELKKSILQKAFTGELTKSKGIAA